MNKKQKEKKVGIKNLQIIKKNVIYILYFNRAKTFK